MYNVRLNGTCTRREVGTDSAPASPCPSPSESVRAELVEARCGCSSTGCEESFTSLGTGSVSTPMVCASTVWAGLVAVRGACAPARSAMTGKSNTVFSAFSNALLSGPASGVPVPVFRSVPLAVFAFLSCVRGEGGSQS